MRIYTRTGDKGQTSLFNGIRVDKDDDRIQLLGTIDELNAFIGLLLTYTQDTFDQKELISRVQSTLFEIGAEIANPKVTEAEYKDFAALVPVLEEAMDTMDKVLPPLKNFILPGGSRAAAHAHVCRTITRRCERGVVTFAKDNVANPTVKQLLNRLSDYFFVLSRYINHLDKIDDVVWKG